jgi:hypothetical protein
MSATKKFPLRAPCPLLAAPLSADSAAAGTAFAHLKTALIVGIPRGIHRPAPNTRILNDSGSELQEQFMNCVEKARIERPIASCRYSEPPNSERSQKPEASS